jgi:hypothetical protein
MREGAVADEIVLYELDDKIGIITLAAKAPHLGPSTPSRQRLR